MIKAALYQGYSEEYGYQVVPLFGHGDAVFEKTASARLLPEVIQYIAGLKPQKDSQYVLVNAMGASEYFGSNVNGDAFTEASLIHRPDNWTGNPELDRIKAKDWPYGFPTFYYAHPYAHHRNKDSSRAFGEVELAVWNDRMKRVELVTRLDRDKCMKFGGVSIWDKIQAGGFPDVSMGTKVPFDTCSICLDWELYRKGQSSFDPKRHKSQGDSVLELHKRLEKEHGKGIRGLSITRKDYCEHARNSMNKILPDGRKVWVFNDYPKFFDISYVFIGADRTAKSMMKIAGDSRVFWDIGSSVELAEKLGYADPDEKTASEEDLIKTAFLGKGAKQKSGEMEKRVIPSQFSSKAVPAMTAVEGDLPQDILNELGEKGLERGLGTSAVLGIVLRPREFQRVVLVSMGQKPLAKALEDSGVVFSRSDEKSPIQLDSKDFDGGLAQLLLPLLLSRSALGPIIEQRALMAGAKKTDSYQKQASLSSGLLSKIGSTYNGYRDALMDLIAHAQPMLSGVNDSSAQKLASIQVEDLFTPMTVAYIQNAFWDELPFEGTKAASASVERGYPSRNT